MFYCTFLILYRQLTQVLSSNVQLGDNCFQIFHFGRYIVGYMVKNLVLWRRTRGVVKRDFLTYTPLKMKILNILSPF